MIDMKKSLLLCLLLTIVFTAKAQDLIRFDSEGKVGFKNSTGEIVIPASNLYPEDFCQLYKADMEALEKITMVS